MTRQLTIGDLTTSEAVAFAYGRGRKTRTKGSARGDAEELFAYQCRQHRLPPYARNAVLPATHLTPKLQRAATWEADGVFQQYMLIVEIQGGVWRRGGGAHSHPVDIVRNMKKQNDFALLGYHVLQFAPEAVRDSSAINYTMRVLAARGWRSS